MNILKNKRLLQKIIIGLAVVISINFVNPTYSQASAVSTFGGMLIGPVVDLFAAIGDVCLSALQTFMVGGETGGGFLNGAWLPEADDTDKYYAPVDGAEEFFDYEGDLDRGALQWMVNPDNYSIPVVRYSPQEIFSNKIPALDVNFIQKPQYDDTEHENNAPTSVLHETIASWYVGLRNLAIVGLLSILVYIGIRIIISSTAQDKSKYKQMIVDWVVALCLLFFLHYIMSFTLTIVDSITQALGGNLQSVNMVVYSGNRPESEGGIIEEGEESSNSQNIATTFSTNLTGVARFRLQYKSFGGRIFYLIIYLALVAYTVMFTFIYLKRVLMMAFLTLIAPLVALTYPLDKAGDGKAQAFDMWLKEFVFNALLQPFHLLIYLVFVGSAMNLAVNNPFYALVVLGFILPAESILRKLFSFNKASAGTIGALGGFTGGAIASGILNKTKSTIAGGKSGNSQKTEGITKDESRVKMKDIDYGAYGGVSGKQQSAPRLEGKTENPDSNQQKQEMETTDNEEMMQDDASRRLLGEEAPDDTSNSRISTPNGGDDREQIGNEQEGNGEQAQSIRQVADNPEINNPNDSMNDDSMSDMDRLLYGGELPKRDLKRGVKTMAGNFKRQITPTKPKVKNLAKGAIGFAAKTAGKTALRAAGAAGGALAGAALGAVPAIVSGDPSKAFKMAAAGGALGNMAGGKAAGAIGRAGSNFAKNLTAASYGNEEIAKVAADKKSFMNNKANYKYFKKEFKNNDGTDLSDAEIRDKMERAFTYTQKGVTNLDEIKQGLKLEDKLGGDIQARRKAVMTMQLGKQISNSDLLDAESSRSKEAGFANQFANNGLSEQQAKAAASELMENIRASRNLGSSKPNSKSSSRSRETPRQEPTTQRTTPRQAPTTHSPSNSNRRLERPNRRNTRDNK